MEDQIKYFKIDVIGDFGYSFLVGTHSDENEDSIINICESHDVFNDAIDVVYASAEKVDKGDYDYNHLEDTLIMLD